MAPSDAHKNALGELFKVIEMIPKGLEKEGFNGLRNARDTWVENMKIIGYEQSQFFWPIFTWKTENET